MLTAALLLAPIIQSGGSQGPALDLQDLLPTAEPELRQAAFAAISQAGEEQYLPPLLDLLSLAETPEEWYQILDAMSAITGTAQREVDRPWRTNSLRLADTEDRQLPDGYLAFKRELYASKVSPEFRRFLGSESAPIPNLDEVVLGGVVPSEIPALDHARTVPAGEADFLPDHAPVIGIVLEGEARAYPHRILDWHELACDTLGGRRIALSWCTMCGAAIAYDATPTYDSAEDDPEPLTFDTSGLLFRSNKLMFDTATDSLWNQFTGEAFSGPMAKRGARLTPLAVVHTTFGRWRAEHPETTVVSPETGYDKDYSEGAAYSEYFASSGTIFPTPRLGRRFAAKERMVVLRHAGKRLTVPTQDVGPGGLLHVTLAEQRFVLIDRSPAPKAMLNEAWIRALEATGGSSVAPTVQHMRDAVNHLGDPPALDLAAVLSLPRATRTALLEREIAKVELTEEVRRNAAIHQLIADIRVFEAGDHTFQLSEDGQLLDEAGTIWLESPQHLESKEDPEVRLKRTPAHFAFGFAVDSADIPTSNRNAKQD